MKVSPSDIKRKFALRAAIRHLQSTSDVCWWLTFTFIQNLDDRKAAEQRWHSFRNNLIQNYWPDARAVGVWARQQRGAWHMHLVASFPGVTDLDEHGDIWSGTGGSENWQLLRNLALRSGFGVQLQFRRVGDLKVDGDKLANYLGNYCTDKNGLDPVRDKGVRRVIYLGKNVKVYDMRWRSSLKRLVSLGRDIHQDDWRRFQDKEEQRMSVRPYKKMITETWGGWFRRLRDYWFQLAWSSISEDEKELFLTEDPFTRRYLETGQWSYV